MRRAVLMIVDGLRADLVRPDLTSRLAALAARGRRYDRHASVFPTATRVNSASIATGCLPGAHGLAGNAIALDEGDGLVAVSVGPPTFRERWRRATGRTLHRPTLAQRLAGEGGVAVYTNSSAGAAHMQDPDGHGWLYHRTGCHAPGLVPVTDAQIESARYDGTGDAVVTERLCAALVDGPPHPLLILWICEPDHSQHALELGSPEHARVVAGADACVGAVVAAVDAARAGGDEILLLVGSDHGHETVDQVVPVGDLLVEAGLVAAEGSRDVVLASSGMGALVYFSDAARPRIAQVADWLRAQPWCGPVFAGADLAGIGHRTDTALGVAFGMGKRDVANRHGVRGLGHVAGDPFTSSDAPGLGQHGGLGPYETRPFLIADGPGFDTGVETAATATTDIAPTILDWLGVAAGGMDGRALARR